MRTTHDDLEPIEPSTARELFLQHKSTECGENTVQSYGYRTGHFVRWCDQQAVENMNDLTGRNLQEYRLWRQADGDLAKITLNQQMSTIRVFLKWCGSIEAVPTDLYEKVMVPRVRPAQERRRSGSRGGGEKRSRIRWRSMCNSGGYESFRYRQAAVGRSHR